MSFTGTSSPSITVTPGTCGSGRGCRAKCAKSRRWLKKTVASSGCVVRRSCTQKRHPYICSPTLFACMWLLDWNRRRKLIPSDFRFSVAFSDRQQGCQVPSFSKGVCLPSLLTSCSTAFHSSSYEHALHLAISMLPTEIPWRIVSLLYPRIRSDCFPSTYLFLDAFDPEPTLDDFNRPRTKAFQLVT